MPENRPASRFSLSSEKRFEVWGETGLQSGHLGLIVPPHRIADFMRHFWILCLSLVCLASCANPLDPSGKAPQQDRSSSPEATKSETSANDLTIEQARQLIPEAASLSQPEFQKILMAPPFDFADLENQSLTAVLLAIDPDYAHKQNYASRQSFHYIGSPFLKPDPDQLKAALQGGPDTPYVSIIQPDYITDCTCRTRGNTANGHVAFRADSLYTGESNFTAKRIEDQWQIVAFDMPEYGLLIERQSDGKWRLVSEESLLGLEYP